MADRNGYNKSLLETEGCFICRRKIETARHEIFGGPNRQISKALGMWTTLCPVCHRTLHEHPADFVWLKAEAQRRFEKEFGHERFMAVFGRNYLEEDEWTD